MAKPFTQIVNEIAYGECARDADGELAKLIAAIKATGKQGSISVKITISPGKRGVANYVEVGYEVSAKIPTVEKPSSIFFPTADNGLSRDDPKQRSLAFGEVDPVTGEITPREVINGN